MLCILAVLTGWVPLHGQVLDDSTKNVYSSKTTFWFTEADVRALSDSLHVLDTLLYGIEDFDAVDMADHRLVDLGNNGTATRSLYYQFPISPGARLGIDAYDPYYTPPARLRYYDTKSPWIKINAVLGGLGRSVLDVSYSRNVNARWNFGFDFGMVTSDKQIGASRNRGDRNVVGTAWDLYTSYKSKNGRYHLLFNVDRLRQNVSETGGIDAADDATRAELFQYRDSPIRLTGVKASDYKFNLHLFQKYELTRQAQAYLMIDRGRHDNSYDDPDPTVNEAVYPQFLITSDSTAELLRMSDLTTEAGMLGKMGGLSYNVYYKRRYVNYSDRFSAPFGGEVESYGGARLRSTLFDVWDTEGKIEYLQGGLFDIEATTQLPFLSLWARSMRYKPGYQQQYYFGNHYNWQNEFDPQRADRIGGRLHVALGPVTVEPELNLTRVANYVYFDVDATPRQSGAGQLLINPSVKMHYVIADHFHIRPEIIYTTVTGNDAAIWRIPAWLVNGRLYYDGVWFNDYMQVQLGLDINWRSAYDGLAYNPVLQQFYLQNGFGLAGYATADLFLAFKVGNARYFAKMTHLNQPGVADGYFMTPYYPGQRRVFDFGVTWYFFD